MLHPDFPLPADIPDIAPIRRLLEAAASLRRRAHFDARNRKKLLAAAERAEAWCRSRGRDLADYDAPLPWAMPPEPDPP
jgi:hypothetical protein